MAAESTASALAVERLQSSDRPKEQDDIIMADLQEGSTEDQNTMNQTGEDSIQAIDGSKPGTTANQPSDPTAPNSTLSKNAQKRLRKQQVYQEKKAERKLRDKMKKKEAQAKKREEAAAQNDNTDAFNIGQKRKAGEDTPVPPSPISGRLTKKYKQTATLVPITILIDCAFDDLMTDKEIVSLSSQITRTYSDNRNATKQVSLHLTSLNKRLLHRFEFAFKNTHKNWKRVKLSSEDYPVTPENIEQGNLIYLTSDSEHTLTELENGKTYIVGGIVDRNRHKGLCYTKATKQGIRTAKLPIGEYIRMSSRFVLTTNQVVEIMLRWLECKDWKEAFLKVIPQRKQPEAREKNDEKARAGQEKENDGRAGEEEEEGLEIGGLEGENEVGGWDDDDVDLEDEHGAVEQEAQVGGMRTIMALS